MSDPYNEYDGGLPLRLPAYPDGTRQAFARLNAILEPYLPKETPMLDLDKPLYDQHGNRWHALTGPDGHAFVTPERVAFLVSEGNKAFPASFDVKRGGFLSSAWNDYVLTNTPPKPDWFFVCKHGEPFLEEVVTVRFGRRNGKLFAEVVE